MRLYNSFSGQTETWSIPSDRPVTMYVCGVTPYDTTHIGHARTYLVFDTMLRYLRWLGAEVQYCQNVTDVDDPLFERARRDGLNWRDLAEQQVERYTLDTAALNILPPTYFPRASEEITGMITLIEQLVEAGYAYVNEGHVYFRITFDPDFGAIARMGYDDMLRTANQRGNNPDDPRKQDPLDFVLWQRGDPDDPTWESPWGPGRPGWHIECSTMAMRYLGPQIDIHGGGNDLIFPHHACEIAQIEPVTRQRPFARFWVHTGMVGLDGIKMSKSLGNLVFIRDALQNHSADALRWYLLSFPYRSEFSYQQEGVEQIEAMLVQIREALDPTFGKPASGSTAYTIDRAADAFLDALDNDLNTSMALRIFQSMSNDIHHAASEGADVQSARQTMRQFAGILGLRLAPPSPSST
ncbi:MAG: cysteine--tRNA ligase [Chloroflexaceae bacterium]|nr:cysteine--tRNA ligase [Chloroflexaceae bacterium]